MKNKLLATSALFGSLVIGSSAYAQTTVTGSLALAYKDNNDYKIAGQTTGTQSNRAFGRESQINVQNKGKLNNGMDYAAGFSLEFDGGRDNGTGTSDENVYIDFISGTTTLTFGQDHIQNTNRTLGILIGEDASDLTAGNAIVAASNFIQSAGANSAQAMGLGVVQKTPVGSLLLQTVTQEPMITLEEEQAIQLQF